MLIVSASVAWSQGKDNPVMIGKEQGLPDGDSTHPDTAFSAARAILVTQWTDNLIVRVGD
jgi:hypothetical protein